MYEIYAFLHTAIIFDKTNYDFQANKVKALTQEDVLVEENPYIFHLQGKRYPNTLGYPELEDPIVKTGSVDTGDIFTLTAHNLAEAHPLTRLYLSKYSNARMALIEKYPDSAGYIMSCIYPIAAEDLYEWDHVKLMNILKVTPFELLSHDSVSNLPEYERVNIVDTFNDYAAMFYKRSYIDMYLQDKYAPTVMMAHFWSLLPLWILHARITMIQTSGAHSELIWMHMASNGIDDYRIVLNRGQEMFLYHNIRHLKSIQGSKDATLLLADEFLTPAGINLTRKHLVIDTTNTSMEDKGFTPVPFVITENIKGEDNLSSLFSYSETLDDIYRREMLDNYEPTHGPDKLEEQRDHISLSKVSKLPTKILELNAGRVNMRETMAFFNFAWETLIYWLNLKDNTSLSGFRFGDDHSTFGKILIDLEYINIPLELTAREAVLLVYYAIKQTGSGRVDVNEGTREFLVGKTIVINGVIIELTDENIDIYGGTIVSLVGPTKLPEKCQLTRPYMDAADASPVPEYFWHFNSKYKLTEFLIPDETNTLRNYTVGDIHTRTRRTFMSSIDELFTLRKRDVLGSIQDYDAVDRTAYETLYKYTVVDTVIDINWLDDSYGTFEDWFAGRRELRDLIDLTSARGTRSLAFEQLAVVLIEKLLPPEMSTYMVRDTGELLVEHDLLRMLFEQLFTYDVTFLRSEDTRLEPIRTCDYYFNPHPDVVGQSASDSYWISTHHDGGTKGIVPYPVQAGVVTLPVSGAFSVGTTNGYVAEPITEPAGYVVISCPARYDSELQVTSGETVNILVNYAGSDEYVLLPADADVVPDDYINPVSVVPGEEDTTAEYIQIQTNGEVVPIEDMTTAPDVNVSDGSIGEIYSDGTEAKTGLLGSHQVENIDDAGEVSTITTGGETIGSHSDGTEANTLITEGGLLDPSSVDGVNVDTLIDDGTLQASAQSDGTEATTTVTEGTALDLTSEDGAGLASMVTEGKTRDVQSVDGVGGLTGVTDGVTSDINGDVDGLAPGLAIISGEVTTTISIDDTFGTSTAVTGGRMIDIPEPTIPYIPIWIPPTIPTPRPHYYVVIPEEPCWICDVSSPDAAICTDAHVDCVSGNIPCGTENVPCLTENVPCTFDDACMVVNYQGGCHYYA